MATINWFYEFPFILNVGVFILCAIIIWLVGSRLTRLADVISDVFGISQSTIGLLFLASATSLPEVATTLTAALNSFQSLVLNNLFGGIVLQTAILAVADGFSMVAISNYPRKADHVMQAVLLIAVLAIVLITVLIQEPIVFGHVGMGTLVVGLTYLGVIWLLRNTAVADSWEPVDLPKIDPKAINIDPVVYRSMSKNQLMYWALTYCMLILVVGVVLVLCAAAVAAQSGIGNSFVGVTLLAAATSLPELTTTITAVRVGAYTLAISNIFGSNLIMLALILPADLLCTGGPILKLEDANVKLSIVIGMLVTSIYIIGFLYRSKLRIGNFGVDSILVLIIYSFSVFLFYVSR